MQTLKTVTIKNENGMKLEVSNFGATILNLYVPNKKQLLTNVVVGLHDESDYVNSPYSHNFLYLGSTIGRYAGRISKGSFKLNNLSYEIEHQNGVHLHGGKEGFDKKFWDIDEILSHKITLSYLSPDLEEGYPGNLKIVAVFEVTNDNALKITYTATTDKATPVNITTHPYINLNGGGTVLEHYLQINSDYYLVVDSQLIPSGEVKISKGSTYDRNKLEFIGKANFKGFDDTFVLKDANYAAKLYSPYTGICMEVCTNQTAMVVYTPTKFEKLPFSGLYNQVEFPAICFEPQNYPDAPNQQLFPNSILKPGDEYKNEIVFQFSVE